MAIYSDIDLTFKPHPLTGDITFKTDRDAVKRALVQLLQTEKWDLPFDIVVQNDLSQTLFEPMNYLTESLIQSRVKFLVERKEPRARLLGVDANIDSTENGYTITINYEVVNLGVADTLDYYIQRVR